MRVILESTVYSPIDVEVKNIIDHLLAEVESIAGVGGRHLRVIFKDDDVKFSHLKPIVDVLTKKLHVEVIAEGSYITGPLINIYW